MSYTLTGAEGRPYISEVKGQGGGPSGRSTGMIADDPCPVAFRSLVDHAAWTCEVAFYLRESRATLMLASHDFAANALAGAATAETDC
jgi:hypothetical protein